MKASELRIGNKVKYADDGTEFEVVQIYSDGLDIKNEIEETYIEIGYFEGIPLTEEWLLKFGFIKDTYPNLHWSKHLDNGDKVAIIENKKYFSNEYLSFFFNCGGINNYSSIDLQIKHVHQLQNLYFALTGEELQLK